MLLQKALCCCSWKAYAIIFLIAEIVLKIVAMWSKKKEKRRREGTCRLHSSDVRTPQLMGEAPAAAGHVQNEALAMSNIWGWGITVSHPIDQYCVTWIWSNLSSYPRDPGAKLRPTSKNTTPLISVGSHAYKGCTYSFHGLSTPCIFDSFSKSVSCTVHRDARGEPSSFSPHARLNSFNAKKCS